MIDKILKFNELTKKSWSKTSNNNNKNGYEKMKSVSGDALVIRNLINRKSF